MAWNYCPHCGEKLPAETPAPVESPPHKSLEEILKDLPHTTWPAKYPSYLPPLQYWPPTPVQRGWDVIS